MSLSTVKRATAFALGGTLERDPGGDQEGIPYFNTVSGSMGDTGAAAYNGQYSHRMAENAILDRPQWPENDSDEYHFYVAFAPTQAHTSVDNYNYFFSTDNPAAGPRAGKTWFYCFAFGRNNADSLTNWAVLKQRTYAGTGAGDSFSLDTISITQTRDTWYVYCFRLIPPGAAGGPLAKLYVNKLAGGGWEELLSSDADATNNADVDDVTDRFALAIRKRGAKGSGCQIKQGYLILDTDTGTPQIDPVDFYGIGCPPQADVTGYKEWAPSDGAAKHYSHVDDCHDDVDAVDDKLVGSDTDKDLWQIKPPDDDPTADPRFVVLWSGGVSTPKHLAGVGSEGAGPTQYTPLREGTRAMDHKHLLLTPEGNAWTRARIRDFYAGLERTAGSPVVYNYCVEVFGYDIADPGNNTSKTNSDVADPWAPVAAQRRRGVTV